MLGHGYVADARDVLIDMHALITRGAQPSDGSACARRKTRPASATG